MPLAEPNDLFSLRRRPPSEKLVDQGFRQLSVGLASIVGLVLLGILLTVLTGAHQAIGAFGLRFITTSDWDPIGNQY
jgi:phosphate transport system permease protein